jgi:glutathione S-transferase
LWTLDEVGVPYVFDEWEVNPSASRLEELARLNPNSMFPILVEAEGPLWESNSICRYITAKAGRGDLLPEAHRARAEVEHWMDWQATDLNDSWRYAFMALQRRKVEYSDTMLIRASGLAAALRQALDIGVPAIRSRTRALATNLRDRLANIPGVTLRDLGLERSGLVSFTLDRMSVGDVRQGLAARQINVAVSGAPYTPLDMTARGLAGVVRASVSYLTTEDEIECLVEAVAELASRSV